MSYESYCRSAFRAAVALPILLCSCHAQAEAWLGKASFYVLKSRTASGQAHTTLTAAHRTLPFGTMVKVTNLSNDHSIIVTVNDRGPFVKGRIIDVSIHAADLLGMRASGVARVKVETLPHETDLLP